MPQSKPTTTHDLKYWAFISYSSLDKKWGTWLHKKLESYPIPEDFRDQEVFDGAVLGKHLRPIFRDRDELPSSSKLEPAIIDALERSRFLIVLCSKKSAKSKWVNKEIEDFTALKPGNKNRILALIIDGEPNASFNETLPDSEECFPLTLRYPMEPLAGDLRKEGDGKERGFLKILSGILQISFDQLYRRHERAQQKKRLALGFTSLIIIGLLSFLAIYALNQKSVAEDREQKALASAEAEKTARQREQVARKSADNVINQMLYKVAPKLREQDLTHELSEITSIANEYFQSFASPEDLSDWQLREKAAALLTSAEMFLKHGNIVIAKALNAQAHKIFLTRYNEDPSDKKAVDLAHSHFRKGDILIHDKGMQYALTDFQRYLDLLIKVYESKQTSEHIRNVAIAHQKMGDLMLHLKGAKAATKHYDKDLALSKQLYSTFPSDLNARYLALSHYKIGEVTLLTKGTKEARPHLEKDLEFSKRLYKKQPSAANLRHLAFANLRMGQLLSNSDHKAAKPHYTTYLESFKNLYKNNVSEHNKRSLMAAYSAMGTFVSNTEGFNNGYLYIQKSLELSTQIYHANPSLKNLEDLAISHQRMGDILLELNLLTRVYTHYQPFLFHSKTLHKKNPTARSKSGLAMAHQKMGVLAVKANNINVALTELKTSLKLYQELYKENPHATTARTLATAHTFLGDAIFVSKKTNSITLSMEHFNKAFKLVSANYESDKSDQNIRELAIANQKMGAVFLHTNEPMKALAHYKNGLKLSQNLLERNQSAQNQKQLAIGHFYLSSLYQNKYLNKPLLQKEHITKSRDLLKKLAERNLLTQQELNMLKFCNDTLNQL